MQEKNNQEKSSTLPKLITDTLNIDDPKVHDLTISQAAEKWPESLSRAFMIPTKGKDNFYFLLTKPERTKMEGISCIVECLKFHKGTGELVKVNLTIKHGYDLQPMTFKEYNDIICLKLRTLKLEKEVEPNSDLPRIINNLEGFGFK